MFLPLGISIFDMAIPANNIRIPIILMVNRYSFKKKWPIMAAAGSSTRLIILAFVGVINFSDIE